MAPRPMEQRVHGDQARQGLEVVSRDGRHFLRYDAGAHQSAWREDEITAEEFAQLRRGPNGEHQTVLDVQRRLQQAGIDPYRPNWTPPDHRQGTPS